METIWFDWKTNPDFQDMLSREIVRTDNQIKREHEKRIRKRQKRKNKNNFLKKWK